MITVSDIENASYTELFGSDKDKQYRELAKICHPDTGGSVELFQALQEKYNSPYTDPQFGDGYTTVKYLGLDAVARMYLVTDTNGKWYLGKDAVSDDTGYDLQSEYQAIGKIYELSDDEDGMSKFIHKTQSTGDNRTLYLLTDEPLNPEKVELLSIVAESYNNMIPEKAIAGWMFKRMYLALSYLHNVGVIHGNITPDCIIVDMEKHNLYLTGFYDTSIFQTPFKAFVLKWRELYPPEAPSHPAPLPSWDIYMIGKIVLWANKSLSVPMKNLMDVLTVKSAVGRNFYTFEINRMWEQTAHEILGWAKEFIPFENKVKTIWQKISQL